MSVQLQRRLFTVDEYYRMAEAGIFSEDDRVELLDGEIVQMVPIGIRHASCVGRLTQLLSERLGRRAIVWVQNPVRLDERSEPQPDVALLAPRDDFYASAHPGLADVLLIIEVAETSTDVDRQVKIPLYARAGVREVWLVDLGARQLEVFRAPARSGYRETSRVVPGQSISPLALPDLKLAVADIIPSK